MFYRFTYLKSGAMSKKTGVYVHFCACLCVSLCLCEFVCGCSMCVIEKQNYFCVFSFLYFYDVFFLCIVFFRFFKVCMKKSRDNIEKVSADNGLETGRFL